MAIATFYPTSYTSTVSNKSTLTNPTNAYADDGSYATITSADNNNTDYIDYNGFDFSSIPSGSTINSVSVETQYKLSTNAAIVSISLQAFNGTTAMGSALTDASEPTSDTVMTNSNTGAWTLSSLPNMAVRLSYIRANNKTSCVFSWDYVSVIVDYTAPVPTHAGVGVIEGTGAILGSATTIRVGLAELIGSGSISSKSFVIRGASAELVGTGSIAGDSTIIKNGYIELVGTGSITSDSTIIKNGYIELVGTGSIASDSTIIKNGYVELTGMGILESTAIVVKNGYIELVGTGSIASDATIIVEGFGELVGTSSILGSGEVFEVKNILMRIDIPNNLLLIKNEIIEGSVMSLSKTGDLIVVELIEGDNFGLDPTGIFTTGTLIEGEIDQWHN